MNPAPNHQPRTAASRADGDARMMSRPGTSPNHARNARLGAGKASTGRAPAASAAYLIGFVRARHTAIASIVALPAPTPGRRAPATSPRPVPDHDHGSGALLRPLSPPEPTFHGRQPWTQPFCPPLRSGGVTSGPGAVPPLPGGRAAAPERRGGGPGEGGEGEGHDRGLGPGAEPVG